MKITQPTWKLVAQLGDAHPIEHGGHFVFVDTTGVYPPEAEVLISPDDDYDGQWEVRRYILEPCTFINGVLSDNKFHPELPAWFAKSIADVASFIGESEKELIGRLTCKGAIARAFAWHAIGEYHGFENLDAYPLRLDRAEVEARYASHPYVNDSVLA